MRIRRTVTRALLTTALVAGLSSIVGIAPSALAASERPPCPSAALTEFRTDSPFISFRLMRCTDRNQVFVELFNDWANAGGGNQQFDCWFRVEERNIAAGPRDGCKEADGRVRYTPPYPGQPLARGQKITVRGAMWQSFETPPQVRHEEYVGTGFVDYVGR